MKEIPNFPGYYAKEDGTIWSAWKRNGKQPCIIDTNNLHKLKQSITCGYLKVIINKMGRRYNRLIHRLVLETFIGPCPKGMEGCHNNGDRTDNILDNLRWDTKKNNQADRAKHGTACRGEDVGTSKLTDEQVFKIRELYKTRLIKNISETLNIPYNTVYDICKLKSWKHLTDTLPD